MSTATVEIRNFAYHPTTLEINLGDSVVWENRDNMGHSARRLEEPAFDTGILFNGESSQPVVFQAESGDAGFEYFCGPHPQMRGTILCRRVK